MIALMIALFAGPLAWSHQTLNFESPIYVDQLSLLESFEIACAGERMRASAKIHVGRYEDTTDHAQVFSGNFSTKATFAGKVIEIEKASAGTATLRIDANIEAANSLARSTGQMARARALLFDQRIATFLLSDDHRAVSINSDSPRPFRLQSYGRDLIVLTADDVMLEFHDGGGVTAKKPPRLVFRGGSHCEIRVHLIDL